jgi:signal peptide peptidase SppA
MTLLDLILSPWAIEADMLAEIQAIYATHLRGEKIDIGAVEARLGRPLANEQQQYSVREGGVAVLPVEGVIAPKANLFTRVSGGTSAQILQQQLESAMADSRVKSIVLAIDSPGGSVYGTPEFAASVQAYAQEKPIVALSDATMASAAYWIGSAANAAFVTGPTVRVGSIGVIATHQFNPSAAAGRTEITAGRYKNIATDAAPLSAEGRAYIQGHVDHLYTVFVDHVAQHRGVSTAQVLEHMADGRVFIGQQAIDAGLVDGISSLDALAEQLATDPQRYARRRVAKIKPMAAGAAAAGETPQLEAAGVAEPSASLPPANHEEPLTMDPKTTPAALTPETLASEHPALFAQLRTSFLAEGAAAERQRIADVRAQTLPGHEKLIDQLAADGKTTGPEAAAAVLAAERQARGAAAKAHFADAPDAAPGATAPADASAATKPDPALPLDERIKAEWDGNANLRNEFTSFEAYAGVRRAEERGRLRVLGGNKRAA